MEQEMRKTIDELFQSKLSDYELSQKEGNWKLLNHLMKEQQKKKTLFFRFKVLFTFLSMASIALLLLFYPWKSNYDSILSSTTIVSQTSQVLPEKSGQAGKWLRRGTKTSNPPITPPKERETPFRQLTDWGGTNSKPQTPESRAIGTGFSRGEANAHSQLPTSNHQLPTSNNQINTADVIITADVNEEKKENEHYLESSSNVVYVNWNTVVVKAKIDNIGKELNSSFADYAPVINADGSEMYFTSRRPVTEKEKKKGQAVSENIYAASFDKQQQQWSAVKLLSAPVNQSKRFNSIIGLSNNGERMLLYRDDKYGNGDIFESLLTGREWSNPIPLPEPINSPHIETSASISPDGKTLYFVSNRPNGQGDLDIWYSTKNQQGKWEKAKNLGNTVNTPEKEEGVFIHPDGKTLYFSSKGLGGAGGYDIFYTRLENGVWTKPQNLGEGINSANDDVYFVMEANGKVGYYSSERKDGMGEKDIFRVTFTDFEKKKDNSPLLTLFKGLVIDKETSLPLAAEIEIIDLEKNEQITTLSSNAATGSFLISLPSGKNYGINVKKNGFLFYSDNMNIPKEDSYKEIIKTVLLEKLKAGSKIVLNNIFYDYDKATLLPASKNELDRLYELLMQNPSIKVELSAHTDSRGSDAYNNKLSQERSQSCLDYLIKKGIQQNQLVIKGYGKQQLLISDEQVNQLKTEYKKETAHQQNRRTEIKILSN